MLTKNKVEDIKNYCNLQKHLDANLDDGVEKYVHLPYRDVLFLIEEVEQQWRKDDSG